MNQWAVRGLQLYIKDSRAGRDLTAGYVPFELLCAPGYGYMLQAPQALRYLFMRNSQIEVRVRNIDRVAQKFALVFTGEKRYCSTEEGGQK